MNQALSIIQGLSAAVIIILVLLQVRGTSLGRSSNSASFTRRGLEKVIFKATFVVSAIFLAVSFLNLLV